MSRLRKALERAKKDLPNIQLYRNERENPVESLRPPAKESGLEREAKREVKIDYSQTRIQPVSYSILGNNKIFALFSKFEVNNQIKSLRTQVLKKLEKIGSNVLMVTSANPGEGKTFTSINLGVSIAQELKRTVLIVDADMKNPENKHHDFSTDFFSISVEKGLADVLMGRARIEDVLINPGIEKLTILPAGCYLHKSAELLGSPQMELLVNEVKSRYRDRIVIFDTPAVLACADPVQLSILVNNVLFVVEEEKTSAEDVRQSMKLFSDVNLIGMILNKSKSK